MPKTLSPVAERWAVSPWNRSGIETSPLFLSPPRIADCTLRDGEQQAGVVFSREDKIALAKDIDAIGVHDLEVGTPAVSDDDRTAIEEITCLGLNAEISAVSRATRDDVDLVKSCGCNTVRISLPISPRQRQAKLPLDDEQYLTLALDICGYAKASGLRVVFSPYDTTRCEYQLLERLLKAFARESCVDRIRVVDTVGAATPEAIRYLVSVVLEAGEGIPIEVHCHNDFGLGVANTLAGALSGAKYLSTTVGGIGERSGNVALEEVVVSLLVLYGVDLGIKTEGLTALAAEVERRSGVPLQAHKAIVGRNSFVHESGMIVAGLLKDPFTAEAYVPELVGQQRRILLGKKSGAAAVRFKLSELGIEPTSERIGQVLERVKRSAISLGRALSDAEFAAIASDVVSART